MSRNLCTSYCTYGRLVTISDLRGKPLEFRRYSDYAPIPGVRFDCPDCGEVYFAYVRNIDSYWGPMLHTGEWKKETISFNGHVPSLDSNLLESALSTAREVLGEDAVEPQESLWLHTLPNANAGRFVHRTEFQGEEHLEETGCYVVDLSYYESYNDEKDDDAFRKEVREGRQSPRHLCLDDAEETRWIWGCPCPKEKP